MTGGYIVRLTTIRIGGGEPLVEEFMVAEPDPEKAKKSVREDIAEGETVEILKPVPQYLIDSNGFKSGEVRAFPF